MSSLTRPLLFIIAALVCFGIAFVQAVDLIDANYTAWLALGLLSGTASRIP